MTTWTIILITALATAIFADMLLAIAKGKSWRIVFCAMEFIAFIEIVCKIRGI